jgi:hypothetical protein
VAQRGDRSTCGARGGIGGRFHGRRCRSTWRRFLAAMAAQGDLRPALSSGQRLGRSVETMGSSSTSRRAETVVGRGDHRRGGRGRGGGRQR